jgi:hypothetical protein
MEMDDKFHIPASLPLCPSGESPSAPIGQNAGWVPEPVWTMREKENPFVSAGKRTPICQLYSPYTDWGIVAQE